MASSTGVAMPCEDSSKSKASAYELWLRESVLEMVTRIGSRVVKAPGIGIRDDLHANLFIGPSGLKNIRQLLRDAHALFAHQRSHARHPAAVGAVLIRPPVAAVNRGGGLQNHADVSRQP